MRVEGTGLKAVEIITQGHYTEGRDGGAFAEDIDGGRAALEGFTAFGLAPSADITLNPRGIEIHLFAKGIWRNMRS